jgi:hypothetical protein
MKTHYKYTNWLSFLKLRSVLTVLMTLAFGAAMAQLSGSYTINSANATSGTNFKSFSDFADSINANGVNGALTVNVVAGSGPYTEQVTFNAVSGVSATNTVTINGNGEVLQFSATSSVSRHTLRLNGTDYFTIDNLEIQARGSSFGRCIWMNTSADHNTVSNCDLNMPNMSSTSNGNAYIVISNGSSSPFSSGDPGEDIVIKDNFMHSRVNNGPYSGIFVSHESSGTVEHLTTIKNNEISDMYYSGIYGNDASYLIVQNNDINNTGWTRSHTITGIYLNNAGKGGGQTIERNKIHDLSGATSGYTYVYGIQFRGGQGSGSRDLIISSNTIKFNHQYYAYGIYNYAYDYTGYINDQQWEGDFICQENDIDLTAVSTLAYYAYGIYDYGYYGAYNSIVERNKINLLSTPLTSGSISGYGLFCQLAYRYNSSGNSSIENNIVNMDKTNYGYGVYAYAIRYPGDVDVLNNTVNMYGYTGGTTGQYSRKYAYYVYYLVGDVENNIASIHDADDGFVYGIYGGYASTNFKNNNLDVQDNPNAATVATAWWQGTEHATLADWQGAQGSANSIEVNPQFVDAPNGDLTPTSFAMVNKGATTGATIDINGTTRSTTAPDMGAIEFFLDAEFTSMNMTGGNECGGYEEIVSITVKNNSANPISDVPVQYDINGGTAVTELIPGPIAAGASMTYEFDEVPVFNGSATHNITSTITGTDDVPSNHTETHTIITTASPYGGDLVGDPNTFNGIYQVGASGGKMNNPDINIADLDITYDVTNPVNVSGTYGTDWELDRCEYDKRRNTCCQQHAVCIRIGNGYGNVHVYSRQFFRG